MVTFIIATSLVIVVVTAPFRLLRREHTDEVVDEDADIISYQESASKRTSRLRFRKSRQKRQDDLSVLQQHGMLSAKKILILQLPLQILFMFIYRILPVNIYLILQKVFVIVCSRNCQCGQHSLQWHILVSPSTGYASYW